jgi:transcriptional regulator with XRE-family HTH domain
VAESRTKARSVDVYVGARMRRRRMQLGMSQQALAARLGVSFQQVQKYEKGANRLSASALYEAAGALAMPVGAFFDGLTAPDGTAPADPLREILAEPGAMDLAREFLSIRRPGLRAGLLTIARELAAIESG